MTPTSIPDAIAAGLSDEMTGRQFLDWIMDAARRAAAEPDADRPLWSAAFFQIGVDLAVDQFGVEETQRWLREAADALPSEAARPKRRPN